MDEKPASDWPLIIDAFNRSLLYDDEGNIISIIPFYADEENGYIVLKNGQYDLPYTTKLNQEQSNQFWQILGDQAAQLLLGISEVIGGSVLWLGSSALGAGGLALSIPSGGTVTIPAAAVASAGYVTSGTLIAGGTITVTDAISQIAAANSNLQVSFAKGYDERPSSNSSTNGKKIDKLSPEDLSSMSLDEIKTSLPEGWTLNENNGFVHIKDIEGNFRIRIDPPDKVTQYTHMHIYDNLGNSLDIKGNIVNFKDPLGHIPWNNGGK